MDTPLVQQVEEPRPLQSNTHLAADVAQQGQSLGAERRPVRPGHVKDAQDKINTKLNEKGINLDDFKAENFKDILDALTEFEMNVDDKKGDKVRIYCGNS